MALIKRVFRNTAFYTMMLAVISALPVQARTIDDVTLPDVISISGSDVELQLNGMGYRTKFVFDVYVGALYTESKVSSRDAAQALTGPKRIVMHMVYDEVSKEKMSAAWSEGFEENNPEEQLEKLQQRLDRFISFFPDLMKGDVVLLDHLPANGTRITINDEIKGVIEGADFFSALMDVWLGEEPADDDLKDAMLGSD